MVIASNLSLSSTRTPRSDDAIPAAAEFRLRKESSVSVGSVSVGASAADASALSDLSDASDVFKEAAGEPRRNAAEAALVSALDDLKDVVRDYRFAKTDIAELRNMKKPGVPVAEKVAQYADHFKDVQILSNQLVSSIAKVSTAREDAIGGLTVGSFDPPARLDRTVNEAYEALADTLAAREHLFGKVKRNLARLPWAERPQGDDFKIFI